MKILRLLFVVAVIAVAYNWWTNRQDQQSLAAMTSPNGFVPVPMPSQAKTGNILIFAPDNCPREGAQRAEALHQALTELGINNVRTSRYSSQSFANTAEARAAYERLNHVMTGEIPIVLVNGMGKANPTLDEVVAEYRLTQ